MNFNSILIANRGEIAIRLIKSARKMGIRCIAIYVDADADSPYVKASDEAIHLPNGGYLDINLIIAAAKKSGAEAIHPGYGFLSENASFARKVIKENIVWIGPSPHAISVMGDKLKAKELAIKANVPTLPMTSKQNEAAEIGYPLLIKAAAGGGGKGMRIVKKKGDLKESIKAAQREAKTGFNDERIFIERYVEKSRHIEIQILGDLYGNIIHLGERECSIQRRHQKIIEESPSPRISDEIRNRMGEAAIKLAKRIKYKSAGTVEFLFDDDTEEFWFLEVNTRLQVEHPVTEEVTGIDLVYEQIRIARGDELSFKQEEIEWNGHAIEARLYAENPANNFLPETGTLIAFEQNYDDKARWDSGVESGSVIGTEFDPMLAKVISHAKTRKDAALKLSKSLESAHIGGVTTNRDFLISTLRTEEFLDGKTTTDFIDIVNPARALILSKEMLMHSLAVAALWLQELNRFNDNVLGHLPSGWTNGRIPKQNISFKYNDEEIEVLYTKLRDGNFNINNVYAKIFECFEDGIDLEYNGRRHFSSITLKENRILIHMPFGDVLLKIMPKFVIPGTDVKAGSLIAPMPGKVIDLRVKKGSKVKAGEILVILEAMKMEHSIKASEDGVISELHVTKDDQVENGAILMVMDTGK